MITFTYGDVVAAVVDDQVPPLAEDIRLGIIDRSRHIGVGRSGSGAFVFIGPQQPAVSALQGSKFEFKPVVDLSPLDSAEPLKNVCILRFEPTRSWEGLHAAVSAVFTGLASTARLLPHDVGPAIHALRELFEADLRSGVSPEVEIGLAGELLAIAFATDRVAMAERWHSAVDATFDFSATGERLDVKTTARSERVHWISSSQVVSVPGACTSFLSVMLPLVESGTTIRDIFETLEDLPDALVARIRRTILGIAGEPPEVLANLQFDLPAARAALRHVAASDVPTPRRAVGVRRMEWEAEFPDGSDMLEACGFASLIGSVT